MPRYHLYFYILLLIIMVIIGLAASIVGFLWMQKRRPLYIIHQGWFRGYYIIFFVCWTLFLASYGIRIIQIDNEIIRFESILVVILLSALAAFLLGVLPRLWRSRSTSTVLILGINGKVLDLLSQAMEKEGIAYQEIHEYIKLTDLDAMVYTTLWSVVGYAALKIDPPTARSVLERIIQTMKAYDKDHNDHFSLRFMILLVFFGLLLAVIGIFFAYSFLTIVIV